MAYGFGLWPPLLAWLNLTVPAEVHLYGKLFGSTYDITDDIDSKSVGYTDTVEFYSDFASHSSFLQLCLLGKSVAVLIEGEG